MRQSLQARIACIGAALGELYLAAFIGADVDAHELNICTLVNDTTVVLNYRFKCYLIQAVCKFCVMLLMHYKDYDFASQPVNKYTRVNNNSFSVSSLRISLFKLLLKTPLLHLHTTLSTSLLPINISFSLTPGTQAQFSSSSRSSTSHQPFPAPFEQSSQLTEAANAAVASREQSQQAALSQHTATPVTHNYISQSPGELATTADFFACSCRRSEPASATDSTPRPHQQLQTAAVAGNVLPKPAQTASSTAPRRQLSRCPRTHDSFLPPLRVKRSTFLLNRCGCEQHFSARPPSAPPRTQTRKVSRVVREDTPSATAQVRECARVSYV